MGYRRAEEILPDEIIKLIQQYVDGEAVYIPRRQEHKREWGASTGARQELRARNMSIYEDYSRGGNVPELAEKYFLSEKSIQRILRAMRASA